MSDEGAQPFPQLGRTLMMQFNARVPARNFGLLSKVAGSFYFNGISSALNLFTHLFTHNAYTVAVSGFSVTETKKDRAAGFLSKPYRPFLISIFLTLLGLR